MLKEKIFDFFGPQSTKLMIYFIHIDAHICTDFIKI